LSQRIKKLTLMMDNNSKFKAIDLCDISINKFTTLLLLGDKSDQWTVCGDGMKKDLMMRISEAMICGNKRTNIRKKCVICMMWKTNWINLDHNNNQKLNSKNNCSDNYFCNECTMAWFYQCKTTTCPLCRKIVTIPTNNCDIH
jgi:hypothetical protein